MSIPHFLLVGNGPYVNRGCEAIVRGTMAILRYKFGNEIKVFIASFGREDLINKQAAEEFDPLITHIALERTIRRYSWAWARSVIPYRLGIRLNPTYPMLQKIMPTISAALEIGGDNYSFSYEYLPKKHMVLDKLLRQHNIPIILWAASISADTTDSKRESMLYNHFQYFNACLMRETIGFNYLHYAKGLQSVYQVADPAFLMEPSEVNEDKIGFAIPANAIGLNLQSANGSLCNGV